MTREEANKYGTEWLKDEYLDSEDRAFIKTALEALMQEPEDAISRQVMKISEAKKKLLIDNYVKSECDVNTSIKEAFTKGFELGLKKAPTILQPKIREVGE